jgi:lysophospholipase L1-like esterase
MAKISQLPEVAAGTIDGNETIPVVKGGLMARLRLGLLMSGLAQPFVDLARQWAEAAAASAASIGITTQTTNDIVEVDQDAHGRWWTQRRLDGTFRVQKLCDAAGNRIDLKLASADVRLVAAETTAASNLVRLDGLEGTLALGTQSLSDVVDTDQDAQGRAWSQKLRDGTTRFNGIRDRSGNRIDTIALDAQARVKAAEDVNAGDIPANIKRLRANYYRAPGKVPVQTSSDFVSLSGNDTGANSMIANGLEYDKSDPRIRRLGGPWVVGGNTFPGNQVLVQKNVTYLAANGSVAGNPQIELLISAGVTQIEIKAAGCTYIGVMIDGRMTRPGGEIVTPPISSGGYRSHLLTLAPSVLARRVRLMFQANVSIGAIRVNPEGRLLDPAIARLASLYVLADSIGEGTGASQTKVTGYTARLGQMGGFDQIANGGVGGSGWFKSISSGENALSRIPDILGNVNGGPPDMLLCGLGINDSNTDTAPIMANIRIFMDQIRAAAPTMPVVAMGPMGGMPGWGAQQAKQAAIFAAMGEYRHTHTIDMYPLWGDAAHPSWYDAADPTHPIDLGHTAIAEYVHPRLLEIQKGL